MIKYGCQDISTTDIDAVVEVLRSDFLTQGPASSTFEEKLSLLFENPNTITVSNATNALHLAYVTLGLSPGDVLWTTSITFVATANAARYCGASVDFVDIDPQTFNLSADKLLDKLKTADELPKILTVVHLGGSPCDMSRIRKICDDYEIMLVEDASHAIGSNYRTSKTGSCDHSDACIFSLHPVKIITSGEGGILTFKKDEHHQKARKLISHGVERDSSNFISSEIPKWYYEQQLLGYNYRMSDIQAALGNSQLSRLDEFVSRRNEISNLYDTLLFDLTGSEKIRTQSVLEDCKSSYHLKVITVPAAIRDKLLKEFKSNEIYTTIHYFPVHLQYYYANQRKYKELEASEKYGASAITLPIHFKISEADVYKVSSIVRSFFK